MLVDNFRCIPVHPLFSDGISLMGAIKASKSMLVELNLNISHPFKLINKVVDFKSNSRLHIIIKHR